MGVARSKRWGRGRVRFIFGLAAGGSGTRYFAEAMDLTAAGGAGYDRGAVSSWFWRCPQLRRSPAFAARVAPISPFERERIMLAFMGIGQWEVLLIVLVIFILFGHRLPSVMRSLGRGVVEFKEGLAGTGKEEGIDEKKDA